MRITEVINNIIPALNNFCKVPVIPADDIGDQPKGKHVTYKLTTPHSGSTTKAEETIIQTETGPKMRRISEYRPVFSFTAYSLDDVESVELAQQVYDWFAFNGYDFLDRLGIVVAEQTTITNRDAFFVENYERRNGFDVILKVMDEKTKDIVEWFDKVELNGIIVGGKI